MTESKVPFASRAGTKLAHALDEFGIDVAGFVCADFGCSTGGFTDCLLKRGAARVYAIDTAYGVLDYRLRKDERVVVMERTNALHAPLPNLPHPNPLPGGEGFEGCDLVTIDLGWTPQRLAVTAAMKWLKPHAKIITLIKPHYELDEEEKRALLKDGRLDHAEAERIAQRVIDSMLSLGARVLAQTRSPVTGGKSARGGEGNIEFLALLVKYAS